MSKLNTLKDYIVAYQNGNEEVLGELITYQLTKEQNEDGGWDEVTRLKFADKSLNKLLMDIKSKYYLVDRLDIESWFLSSLVGDKLEQGLMYQVDTSFSDNEVISYVVKRVEGHIKNMIAKERLFDENVIPDTKITEDSDGAEEGTYFDDSAYREWQEIAYDDNYQVFLENSGGMEKLLSKKQYEVFFAVKEGSTQQQIADELGVSQQDIQQTITASMKRIKTAYMSYKTYELLANDKAETYEILSNFEKQYQAIMMVDVNDSFDYFTYTVNWLLEHVSDKDEVDYEELQLNRQTHSMTVLDVIADHMTGGNSKVLTKVLTGKADEVGERDKDRFVMAVLRAIKSHQKNVKKSVADVSKNIVNNIGEDKYDDISYLFK